MRLLDASGAVYLDTQESRGLVPADHPSVVGAMRGAVMGQADLVVIVGRKLDYQLGYGSPAVFPQRAIHPHLRHRGRTDRQPTWRAELLATPALALDAILAAGQSRKPALDRDWARGLRAQACRAQRRPTTCAATGGGRQNPPRCDLRGDREVPSPTCIAIADGGDLLSFARVGLEARPTWMPAPSAVWVWACPMPMLPPGLPGPAGDLRHRRRRLRPECHGNRHGRPSWRKIVWIVSNNAAWNIERFDQDINYGGRVVGTTLRHSDYAAMARALGLHGERVTDPADWPVALAARDR